MLTIIMIASTRLLAETAKVLAMMIMMMALVTITDEHGDRNREETYMVMVQMASVG